MNGRLEDERKIEIAITELLNDMPVYVTEWYYSLKASRKTAATCRDFVRKIKRYLESINNNAKSVELSDITALSVTKYFISIQKTTDKDGNEVNTSDSYQQTVWCCLNNFFSFLVTCKYIDTNYMTLISKPKNRDLDRINENRILLTENDFSNIINSVKCGVGSHKARCFQYNMKERDLAIMYVFMTTGMRKTALSEINVEDLDLDNNKLIVTDKGDKLQVYKLDSSVVDVITEWLYKRETMDIHTDALFVSSNGGRMSGNTIYKMIEKYCQDALGYPVSPHKLRSGFCSIMYNKTGDIEFVRRAVGHSNISTTQRYIVTSNSERETASGIIASFL